MMNIGVREAQTPAPEGRACRRCTTRPLTPILLEVRQWTLT
nr:MAG TPA: hypothetical protein [Caudoviricetes sp.]